MATIQRPEALPLGIRDTGALERLGPWPGVTAFTLAWLAEADGRRVALRGDELTIYCINGAATYVLSPGDNDQTWRGTLARAWEPSRCL